ncbi:YbcC family protein [Aliidiomarina iranensis]|nr:DUF2309 domain-containing protein [Aliidiomarina iranensis]
MLTDNAEHKDGEVELAAISNACRRIAPTWPLDQSIAVNPWWEFRDQGYGETAQHLQHIAAVDGFAAPEFYLDAYSRGEISDWAIARAAERLQAASGNTDPAPFFLQSLKNQGKRDHLALFSGQVDKFRDNHYMRWQEEIVHQISQFCAAHFQSLRPMLGKSSAREKKSLYAHWLEVSRVDYGLSIVLSAPKLRPLFRELPDSADALIQFVVAELNLSPDDVEDFALACLYDVHGWASWVAYRQWQTHTATGDDYYSADVESAEMRELLAIRMAWEWLVFTYVKRYDNGLCALASEAWRKQWRQRKGKENDTETVRAEEVWGLALELEYQKRLEQKLPKVATEKQEPTKTWMQAVFCIDVRSEVIRRALEQQHDGIETKGFAGFFGVPLAYQPKGSALVRSQTPGLLSPALRVEEWLTQQELHARLTRLNNKARLQTWSSAAPAAFSMVESMGLIYGPKLLKGEVLSNSVNDLSHVQNWQIIAESDELDVQALTDVAEAVLQAMSFKNFAPLVLLVGHGSESRNNLQASALDCGACCGQTGEVNSRVLAQILNHPKVRAELPKRGIDIPEETRFVPALHNTTTDDIRLLDTLKLQDLPMPLEDVLAGARSIAQRERLTRFEPAKAALPQKEQDGLLRKRGRDWSQQRPEWGLVNNAAFIIAPRSWTRHVNLEGRSFLHDYCEAKDPDKKVLTLLMTAPMIVTHWINMQYNMSVCEPLKFGSGNKVLHNAVGGSIGVFEGNGGDLRIGLARQSVFDGEKWLHTPQRLTVVIAAEQDSIADVVAEHKVLQQLIDNDWLHILQWQIGQPLMRFYKGEWQQNIEN